MPGVVQPGTAHTRQFLKRQIAQALLQRLVQSARDNGLESLEGLVSPGNRAMLALCRGQVATVRREDALLKVQLRVGSPPPRRQAPER